VAWLRDNLTRIERVSGDTLALETCKGISALRRVMADKHFGPAQSPNVGRDMPSAAEAWTPDGSGQVTLGSAPPESGRETQDLVDSGFLAERW
jgi:hypothetical protein